MEILPECKDFCREENLLQLGDRVLLAVSGGPDSLALLDIFDRLKDDWNLDIGVFHLNHCLREAAAEEAEFVKEVCEARNIPCWLEKVDVKDVKEKKGSSLEETAREIRLALLCKYAKKKEMDAVALGHQANDRAETVIFNLIRGAGLPGLTGISPKSYHRDYPFIRPLLKFTKDQLENYCHERSLEPRIDSSNFSTDYDRNKIRQELIPYLEKNFNPELISILNSTADLISSENEFLQELAKKVFVQYSKMVKEHRIDLEIEPLKEVDMVLRRRVWRITISKLKGSTEGYYKDNFAMLEDIINNSADKEGNKTYHLPGQIIVQQEYGVLSFRDEVWQERQKRYTTFSIIVETPGKVELPDGRLLQFAITNLPENWQSIVTDENICLVDNDKISWPLNVRNRKAGDKFKPLGMTGSKKIKDFFIDEKIPTDRRDKIPLVVDNRDRIVWVAGMRCGDNFKVTSDTQKVLKIKLKN